MTSLGEHLHQIILVYKKLTFKDLKYFFLHVSLVALFVNVFFFGGCHQFVDMPAKSLGSDTEALSCIFIWVSQLLYVHMDEMYHSKSFLSISFKSVVSNIVWLSLHINHTRIFCYMEED